MCCLCLGAYGVFVLGSFDECDPLRTILVTEKCIEATGGMTSIKNSRVFRLCGDMVMFPLKYV